MKKLLLIALTLTAFNVNARTVWENVLCGTLDYSGDLKVDWSDSRTRAHKQSYIYNDESADVIWFDVMPETDEALETLRSIKTSVNACVVFNRFPEMSYGTYFLEAMEIQLPSFDRGGLGNPYVGQLIDNGGLTK